jgi:hypothetical protein
VGICFLGKELTARNVPRKSASFINLDREREIKSWKQENHRSTPDQGRTAVVTGIETSKAAMMGANYLGKTRLTRLFVK